MPGVSPPNLNSTQLFAETSAVTGMGIAVGSQRNFSNNFIVDGLSANDDAAGLSGMPYGVDAVDQFQVVTSGGQAELGRALGGYVNVVTRSGTNITRGDIYGYFRDDSLNAKNVLSGAKLPMSQKQYGASVGGPLARNRTFYFVNVEQRLLDQTGLTTISDANVAVINARLDGGGLPGLAGRHGHLRESRAQRERDGEGGPPVQREGPRQRPLQPLRRVVRQRARSRRPQRAVGLRGARQPGPRGGIQQHDDARLADRERDARAVHARRPQGAAHRSRSVRR